MKTRFVLPFLCACLWQASAAAAAPCGSYTVAFYDHGALNSLQADGHWRGIDTDVVNELARRTGCQLTLVLESRVRIWTMLKSGRLDMTVSGIATPERETYAQFIPYLASRNYVLLSKEVEPNVQSLEALAADTRYKVAAVKSFRHGPTLDAWLATLRAQGRVYDAVDVTALMRLVKSGRVHAVIALETSWVPWRAETAAAGLRVMDWAPMDPVIGGLVLSRKRIPGDTVILFANALAAMRRDGTLEAIFVRHMGAAQAPAMLRY
ncbi:MAG: transporter substrate-binding domain-containing protein [Pseudomonadota bacterium]